MQQWSRRNALALIAGASVALHGKKAFAAQPAQSLGAIAARTVGASMVTAAARVAFWGALAMALTAGVGALFGVAA